MKRFESVIELLSKDEIQQKIYDPNEQKLVRINDNTGKEIDGFFSAWGATSSYYLVSNSNLTQRALYTSPKVTIEDRNERKIEIFVECEVSCPPGNEVRLAEALHSTGKSPIIKLNRFISQCINKFRNNDEDFIDNFFVSNIAQQIEESIGSHKETTSSGIVTHITGLQFHKITCLIQGYDPRTISISLRDLKIGFKDSVEKHSILFDCDLVIDEKNETNARLRNATKADFDELLRKSLPEIFGKHIAEISMYEDFEEVTNKLKTYLNERVEKYGRMISALKLQDLHLKDLESKRNIEIEIGRKKFFALDREDVEMEIFLTAKVRRTKDLIAYKDYLPWLKAALKEKAENAIIGFISEMEAGEFDSRIERPNAAFREEFLKSIKNKTDSLIDAEIFIKKIELSKKEEKTKIDELREKWIPFNAHIVSQVDGECSINGSFIVAGDAPQKRAMRSLQKFNVEDVKNKIVETLGSWLNRFSAAMIISTNHYHPENFEKALKKLLLDKVVEAFGVNINIQNIKTEIVNQSATSENIRKNIVLLEERLVEAIAGGANEAKIKDLENRIKGLDKLKDKHMLSLGQSNGSSDNSPTTSGSGEINSLLREVNQLLLEEANP